MEPVANFCVSRGLHFPDFIELAKLSFVKAAERKLMNMASSTSKLSVMTGIQRPEINRLRQADSPADSKDFITRILGQWGADKRFVDKRKRPRKLSTEGKDSEFHRLVHTVSKDLNPNTIRFELERLGLVKNDNGYVTLERPDYIASGDPAKTLLLAAEDASDLLVACEENAFNEHAIPNLHARTYYDKIPDEVIPQIREWSLELGKKIHEECRAFLSQHDEDINSKSRKGTGRNRVVVGTTSSGSGVSSYEGNVSTSEGRSLSNVSVTIETTGDSTVTDEQGEFAIDSDAGGKEVPFLLESSSFTSRFTLKDIPEETSRITMQIILDPNTGISEVRNVNVGAWFAGLCDIYFENREVIRQANRVPPGTVCSLNVRVFGDGRPLRHIPIALEYSACTLGSEWKLLQTTQTGEGRHQGYAEINFPFIDSAEYCRYRVVAPYNDSKRRPVTYPIDTLTEQEYVRKHAS